MYLQKVIKKSPSDFGLKRLYLNETENIPLKFPKINLVNLKI